MNEQEIYSQLEPIFQDIFDDDDLELAPDTTPSDVENWDSLSNIRLFIAVEKALGVRFDTKEIAKVETIGGFVQMIMSKKAA